MPGLPVFFLFFFFCTCCFIVYSIVILTWLINHKYNLEVFGSHCLKIYDFFLLFCHVVVCDVFSWITGLQRYLDCGLRVVYFRFYSEIYYMEHWPSPKYPSLNTASLSGHQDGAWEYWWASCGCGSVFICMESVQLIYKSAWSDRVNIFPLHVLLNSTIYKLKITTLRGDSSCKTNPSLQGWSSPWFWRIWRRSARNSVSRRFIW